MTRAPGPVLLIADHKWRDLASLCLLKVLLEDEHGIPARIVNYTFWDAAMLAGPPHLEPMANVLSRNLLWFAVECRIRCRAWMLGENVVINLVAEFVELDPVDFSRFIKR